MVARLLGCRAGSSIVEVEPLSDDGAIYTRMSAARVGSCVLDEHGLDSVLRFRIPLPPPVASRQNILCRLASARKTSINTGVSRQTSANLCTVRLALRSEIRSLRAFFSKALYFAVLVRNL
jgi:hypothetical protein